MNDTIKINGIEIPINQICDHCGGHKYPTTRCEKVINGNPNTVVCGYDICQYCQKLPSQQKHHCSIILTN